MVFDELIFFRGVETSTTNQSTFDRRARAGQAGWSPLHVAAFMGRQDAVSVAWRQLRVPRCCRSWGTNMG